MDLHNIQRQILQKLIQGKHRFSELQPVGVENNLFQYHLRKLIGAKVVSKSDEGYDLTPLGYQLSQQWSTDLQKVRLQPTVVVMLLIRNASSELLALERDKEPFLGKISPPFGKLHYGESLQSAAVRELYEKTGLQQVDLESAGVAELRVAGMHTLAHLFTGRAEQASRGAFVSVTRLVESADALPGLAFLEPQK